MQLDLKPIFITRNDNNFLLLTGLLLLILSECLPKKRSMDSSGNQRWCGCRIVFCISCSIFILFNPIFIGSFELETLNFPAKTKKSSPHGLDFVVLLHALYQDAGKCHLTISSWAWAFRGESGWDRKVCDLIETLYRGVSGVETIFRDCARRYWNKKIYVNLKRCHFYNFVLCFKIFSWFPGVLMSSLFVSFFRCVLV